MAAHTTVGRGLAPAARRTVEDACPYGGTAAHTTAGRAVSDAILSKAPSGRELAAVRLTEGVTGSDNKQRNNLYSCFVS